jgi:multimeric flavodoxin WrbA
VYWYQVSAQFKMLVDRLYSFMGFGVDPETGAPVYRTAFPKGKNFVLLISRGDPEPPPVLPQLYDHLNEWLNLIPMTLGAGRFEMIHQYGADINRKAAEKDVALLERARIAGERLA